jgi:HEPN domain-containing protein
MEFEVNRTVNYWIEGAEYDISVSDVLFQAGKYPYALFIAHLSIEKLLKALVVIETKEHAPHTHSLPLLADKMTFEIPKKLKIKLAGFMEFYFEVRYPEDQKTFYKKCTMDFTAQKLVEMKEVFEWLRQKLSRV